MIEMTHKEFYKFLVLIMRNPEIWLEFINFKTLSEEVARRLGVKTNHGLK